MEIFFNTLGFLLAVFVFYCFIVIFFNIDRMIVIDKKAYNEIKKYGFNLSSYMHNLIYEDMKKREKEKNKKAYAQLNYNTADLLFRFV